MRARAAAREYRVCTVRSLAREVGGRAEVEFGLTGVFTVGHSEARFKF